MENLPSLNATLTLPQMRNFSSTIPYDLHFHMLPPGSNHSHFYKELMRWALAHTSSKPSIKSCAEAERSHIPLERVLHLILLAHNPNPPPTSTIQRFDDHWVS